MRVMKIHSTSVGYWRMMKGNKAFKKYFINHEVPIAIVVVGIIKAIPHFFKDQEKNKDSI